MVEAVFLGQVLTVLLLALVLLLLFKVGKALVWLLVNSVIGLVALLLTNILPMINININMWSILIVALGGLPGLLLLMGLDCFNIAF